MATTSSGIYYPTVTDDPDVPGDMLAMANSLETLVAAPFCKLLLAANFGVANNSNSVTVPFGSGSEIMKSHASMHSTTVNNTRVTPPLAGLYRVSAITSFAPNTTGFSTHSIGLNGSRQNPEGGVYNSGAMLAGANVTLPQITAYLNCNGTTDYVELFAYQNSGGTLNGVGDGTVGNTGNTMMIVEYIRPRVL